MSQSGNDSFRAHMITEKKKRKEKDTGDIMMLISAVSYT